MGRRPAGGPRNDTEKPCYHAQQLAEPRPLGSAIVGKNWHVVGDERATQEGVANNLTLGLALGATYEEPKKSDPPLNSPNGRCGDRSVNLHSSHVLNVLPCPVQFRLQAKPREIFEIRWLGCHCSRFIPIG